MTHARTTLALAAALACPFIAAGDDPVVITFDKAETGKPTVSHAEQGVVFAPARPPAAPPRG